MQLARNLFCCSHQGEKALYRDFFVFLKRLSDAIRDDNPVLAVIPSTAVYQNINNTPLFVPNAPSLSRLFSDVLRSTKVSARDISLVEAHNTDTPVGDPAEYESIRTALKGPASGRLKKLPIESVKGHIGHTENASGVLALIKVMMMMRGAFIPPQASSNKMNHGIDVRADDIMEVVTKLRPWEEDHKMALINNYGACGSNASLTIAQPSKSPRPSMAVEETSQYPFWIPGLDARAISAYAAKLSSYCRSLPQESSTLANISYVLNRQSNPGLTQSFIFSCRSMPEFQEKLTQMASAPEKNSALRAEVTPAKASRPVILCFGGQVSLFVELDRKLYDSVTILRLYSAVRGWLSPPPGHGSTRGSEGQAGARFLGNRSWSDGRGRSRSGSSGESSAGSQSVCRPEWLRQYRML